MATPPLKGSAFKKENSNFANLKVSAQESPNLTLRVSEGAFWTSGRNYVEYGGGNSPVFTVPTTNPRWSILALLDNGALQVIDGIEVGDPKFPEVSSGRLPIAAIYLLSTDTTITEDMIFDVRPDFHLSVNSSSLAASIAGFGSDIAVLQASATAHHQSISVLNASVANLDARVSNIEVAASSNLASQIGRLDNTTAVNASDITILQASATAHHQSINILNASVAAVSLQASNNASAITDIRASVTANASSITVLFSSVFSNASSISTLFDSVSALNTSVLIHHQSISTLDARVSTLEVTGSSNLASQIGVLTASVAANASSITVNQAATTSNFAVTNASVTANASSITVLFASLTAHEAADASNFVVVNASVAANASAITVLQASVTQNASEIAAIKSSALAFPLLAPDGTGTAPSYSFASNTDSGFYRLTGCNIALAVGGCTMLTFVNSGGARSVNLAGSTIIRAPSSSATNPYYTFNADTDTGMYFELAGRVAFAGSGVEVLRASKSATVVSGSVLAPAADVAHNIGSSALQWDQIWASAIHLTEIVGASTAGWTLSASGHLVPTTGSAQDIGSSAIPIRSLYMSGSTLWVNNTAVIFASAGVIHGNFDAMSGSAGTGTSFPLAAPNGSAPGPSYSFSADTTTGLFSASIGTVAVAASGVEIVTFTSEGAGQIQMPDGTVGAPSYSFTSDPNTGIFSVGGDILGLVAGASTMLQLTNGSGVIAIAPLEAQAGVNVTSGNLTMDPATRIYADGGTSGSPGFSFASSMRDGLWLEASGVWHLIAGAGGVARISAAQFRIAPAGTAANPGVTVGNETDTGMYRVTTNELGFAAGGSAMLILDEASSVTVLAPLEAQAGLDLSGGDLTLTGSGQILPTDGSVGAPVYSFASDPDTGIYTLSVGTMSFAVSGIQAFRIQASAGATPTLRSIDNGNANNPSYSFNGQTGTGMFLNTDALAFTQNNSNMFQMDQGSGVTVIAPLEAQAGVDLSGGDLTLTGSGQIMPTSGSGTGPGYAFSGCATTGIYKPGVGQISFTSFGTTRFHVGLSGGIVACGTQVRSSLDSSQSTPAYTFLSGTNGGLYKASDRIGISSSGIAGISVGSNQVLIHMNGSTAAPGLAFGSDVNTGMFWEAAGILGFAAEGSTMFRIDQGSSVTVVAPLHPGADVTHDLGASTARWNTVFASRILANNGSGSGPTFGFRDFPDTGMYAGGAGQLRLAASGLDLLRLQASQVLLGVNGGVGTGNPVLAFASDTDTGIGRFATNDMHMIAGGSSMMRFLQGTGIIATTQIRGGDGSAALPEFAFANDPDTGMYSGGTNTLGFAAGGVKHLTMGASQVLIGINGCVGVPALAFASHSQIGFAAVTGKLLHVQNNASVIAFQADRIRSLVTYQSIPGSAGGPSYSFDSNATTGMYSAVATELSFAAGGSQVFRIDQGSSITALADVMPGADVTYALGSSTLTWSRLWASAVHASTSDVAERYEADAVYEKATVMIFGGAKEITESYQMNDTRVAGPISTAPALKMNAKAGADDTHPYIGLRGKVPCKMKGPVRKGDLITTSDHPGYGQAATEITPHWAVFAKSLEDLDGSAIISVVV